MSRILAVSGSLRAESSNGRMLRAMAALVPGVTVFAGIGELPHFNPDLDVEPALSAVAAWREALRSADAVLICSPEYAHGVPGSLKNALDWVVGSGEFVGKPVGLINVSPLSTFAQDQLAETFTVMMAKVTRATIVLPRRDAGVEELAQDEGIARAVRGLVEGLR